MGRQLLKLVVFSSLLLFIINQYVNPTVANSPHPLSGSAPRVIERVLKLSIPTLYVWLCMFYCFFHLWLNIAAELLRFGDREFYKVRAPVEWLPNFPGFTDWNQHKPYDSVVLRTLALLVAASTYTVNRLHLSTERGQFTRLCHLLRRHSRPFIGSCLCMVNLPMCRLLCALPLVPSSAPPLP